VAGGYRNSNGNSWVLPSVIAGGIALINAFWIVVWGTVNSETSRLQREIDRLYTRSEETYTKKENTEQYRQRNGVEIKNLQLGIDQAVAQTRRLRDDTITRDAYNGRHEALQDDVKRLNSRLDEIRKDFGGAYTLSDKIKELQDQIKLLQTQNWKKPTQSQTP